MIFKSINKREHSEAWFMLGDIQRVTYIAKSTGAIAYDPYQGLYIRLPEKNAFEVDISLVGIRAIEDSNPSSICPNNAWDCCGFAEILFRDGLIKTIAFDEAYLMNDSGETIEVIR